MPKNNELTQIPYHIGIIPDGNRRWAKISHINMLKSYNIGIKKAVECAAWAGKLGVKVITAWALSKENLNNRSKNEINTLFKLYTRAAYSKSIRRIIDSNNIKVRPVGELNLIPAKAKKALSDLAKHTAKNTGPILNVLVCYSGKDDILHAFSRKGDADSEKALKRRMVSRSIPDLDLIIRTSGEMRLSGFLPLQSTYAELYFTNKYWPEVEKEDIEAAIKEFSGRKRRFGK
ncbi:MAG: polyprenyl diphosphate synthase [Candidatus Micrarchaeaceae archaeon]